VEAGEEGEGVVFVLEDGTKHKSPSAAGSKVMGGKAVNGWRFWSLEGDAPQAEPAPATKAAKTTRSTKKAKKLISRIPSQKKDAEGSSRWFCAACMKSFMVDGNDPPQVCPDGHRIDDPELTGTVGTPEKGAEAAAETEAPVQPTQAEAVS
jgi:hypothetical protein